MGVVAEVAHVAHECAGRLRLKVPAHRGDEGYFRQLAARVATATGVQAVEANPATGGILVLHSLAAPAARSAVAASAGLRISTGAFRTRAVLSDARRLAAGLDRRVAEASGGELDLWSASFLALLGLGLNELRRGNVAAPAWYTAFWYAFNVLLKSPEGGRDRAAGGQGRGESSPGG
jgi:hypothetical protein